MDKENYITLEFDKIIKELHTVITNPKDLDILAISLQLTNIQCLILDSAFKGLPTINLGKILLIIPAQFYSALESMTLKLAYVLQNKTCLDRLTAIPF